jgi:RES domain-containing protein
MVRRLEPPDLPGGWNSSPVPVLVQHVGDAWIAAAQSAVLEVPSAVIEGETNFLLNPAHPDFSKIVQGHPKPFAFDPRLIKS